MKGEGILDDWPVLLHGIVIVLAAVLGGRLVSSILIRIVLRIAARTAIAFEESSSATYTGRSS